MALYSNVKNRFNPQLTLEPATKIVQCLFISSAIFWPVLCAKKKTRLLYISKKTVVFFKVFSSWGSFPGTHFYLCWFDRGGLATSPPDQDSVWFS